MIYLSSFLYDSSTLYFNTASLAPVVLFSTTLLTLLSSFFIKSVSSPSSLSGGISGDKLSNVSPLDLMNPYIAKKEFNRGKKRVKKIFNNKSAKKCIFFDKKRWEE